MSISAAVTLITIEKKHLLILKRATNQLDPWSGQLSLPGGKIDATDISPLAAAIRETWEECKIDLHSRPTQELVHEFTFAKHGDAWRVAPFHFDLPEQPEVELAVNEHSDFYWVPIDYLKDKTKHREGYLSKHFPEQIFPYIDVAGTPLWGFTYKVLQNFLNW